MSLPLLIDVSQNVMPLKSNDNTAIEIARDWTKFDAVVLMVPLPSTKEVQHQAENINEPQTVTLMPLTQGQSPPRLCQDHMSLRTIYRLTTGNSCFSALVIRHRTLHCQDAIGGNRYAHHPHLVQKVNAARV